MRTGGNTWENVSLENCVQSLNLNPSDCLQTITSDELWLKYGPQTLKKAIDFIVRVVKEIFAMGKSMRKVVQQTNQFHRTRPH